MGCCQNVLFGDDSSSAKVGSQHYVSLFATTNFQFSVKTLLNRSHEWIFSLGRIISPDNSSIPDRTHFQDASCNCNKLTAWKTFLDLDRSYGLTFSRIRHWTNFGNTRARIGVARALSCKQTLNPGNPGNVKTKSSTIIEWTFSRGSWSGCSGCGSLCCRWIIFSS